MARPGYHTDDYLSDSSFEAGDDSDGDSAIHDFAASSRTGDTNTGDLPSMSEAQSKAQEAAVEQRMGASSAAQLSQLSSPALSATSMPWSEPDVSNFFMGPPDYATAIANQPTYGSFQQSTNNAAPATAQQQSMSDTVPLEADEEAGLLTDTHKDNRQRRCRPNWCGPFSTCNTVLVIAVILLVSILSQAVGNGHKGREGDETTPKLPKTPNNSTGDGEFPPRVTQPYFPDSQCVYQYYSEAEHVDFPSPRNFSFTELLGFTETLPMSEEVEGTVHVQPSTQLDQGVDIRVRIVFATTSELYVTRSNYIRDGDNLALVKPDLQRASNASYERSCLGVFVGIEVRPGVELENWALLTGNLDVIVTDGLFDEIPGTEQPHLDVNGNSNFTAISGKGEIAYWSSRRLVIEFGSQTIRGAFALRDLLHLKTVSGDVDVTVDPKPADPAHAVPAEFEALSTSGSIDIRFPFTGEQLPPRHFRTTLETVSSPIRGTYISGTAFSAHSTSGDIQAELLPYFIDQQRTSLHTDSRSGKTFLNLLPPYPAGSWSGTSTEHRSTSTSGSINIVYPPQWEGGIVAETISGGISIQGKDVSIIDERDGPGLKRVRAEKGSGSSRLGSRTISGDIRVQVDD